MGERNRERRGEHTERQGKSGMEREGTERMKIRKRNVRKFWGEGAVSPPPQEGLQYREYIDHLV